MSKIFLSHAVADNALAKLLTSFLKEAIGVPAKEIFCSSVPGHGVPLTQDFNAYMKDKIQKPELVLLLMTPAYMESRFCLMELGAAWAQGKVTLPIVVPPVSYNDVTRTLGLIQAWRIENHQGLIDLRAAVITAVPQRESRTEHDWEDKRKVWQYQSKKIVTKLQGWTNVPVTDHKAVLSKIDDHKAEIADLESLIETKDDMIEKLKATKDKTAVKAILKAASAGDPEEEFDGLIDD